MAIGITTILVFILLIGPPTIGIAWVSKYITSAFRVLDPNLAILLALISLTALLCAWLVAAAIRSSRRRAIQSMVAAERATVYEAVLQSLIDRLNRTGNGASAAERTLFLTGSKPVVREYGLLLGMLSGDEIQVDLINQQANRLLLAMRRDYQLESNALEDNDWASLLGIVIGAPREHQRNGPGNQLFLHRSH